MLFAVISYCIELISGTFNIIIRYVYNWIVWTIFLHMQSCLNLLVFQRNQLGFSRYTKNKHITIFSCIILTLMHFGWKQLGHGTCTQTKKLIQLTALNKIAKSDFTYIVWVLNYKISSILSIFLQLFITMLPDSVRIYSFIVNY